MRFGFNFGFFRSAGEGGIVLPPALDKLLVWLKGDVTDTERIDSYTVLIDAPMELKESGCLLMSGSDTITMVGHGTVVSSEGTGTPTYDNTTLSCTSGTLYNVEFSDGTIWAFAETSSTAQYVFDTTGEYSGQKSSSNLALMNSGRQDSYHYNTVEQFGKRQNLPKYSEALSNGAWSKINTNVSGSVITFSATTSEVYQSVDNVLSETNGSTVIVKFRLKAGTASSVYIGCTDTESWSSGRAYQSDEIELTSEYADYYFVHTYSGSTTGNKDCALVIGLGGHLGNSNLSAGTIEIESCQLEDVTGTTQTAPGAYIETTGITFDGTEYLPFLDDNPGNTWNDSEVKQAFGQRYVGTFDGTTSEISTIVDHDTIVSYSGTATPSYDGSTITANAGTLYDILFSDGTLIPLNEGEGTDIHDDEDNSIGTLSTSNPTAFWANKVTPQALLDMDTAYYIFTDASGNVKTVSQAEVFAACNSNDQYFRNLCPARLNEVTLYDQVLIGDELAEVQADNCVP